MIEIKNIIKEYRNGDVVTKVLNGVSFNIEKGDFLAIMGPSGSGKSTLMHILGLLDRATSGDYLFEGTDINKLNDNELAKLRSERLGFVFQTFNLLPRTSVLDNVILPLVYTKAKNKKNLAKEMIEAVGLSHRLYHHSNQLSGGEQQRVAIARALINDPSLILADEPTGNLDSKSGLQIMEILQDLNEGGRTIILVTHETYTAEYAKRKIALKDGTIILKEMIGNRRLAKNGGMLK